MDTDLVTSRVPRSIIQAIDAWIAAQPEPRPSRSDALRLALHDWLTGLGLLPGDDTEAAPEVAQDDTVSDRYADADPNEGVMVTGVGPMTLRRAVRKLPDWREHHGLGLINIYRGADKRPGIFDEADLGRLAGLERFR
jgi:Arc/MetJ-type ribon-helix-helix transcriptional regulator